MRHKVNDYDTLTVYKLIEIIKVDKKIENT